MKIGDRYIATENKALILLAAKVSKKESLVEESKRLAAKLLRHADARVKSAAVMARVERDPFRLASKAPGYDVTIELHSDAEQATLAASLRNIADELPSARSEPSAGAVLVGTDYVFRPCTSQPVRFQYLMRRRTDLTHEAYARHYAEVHSAFGYRTRGVNGYAQLHVDALASAAAVRSSGVGICHFDGVSQLHMASLMKSLLASPINGALGMVKDEKRFVDRDHSAMFSSRVVAYLW